MRLETRQMTKRFGGVKAVHNISVEFLPGQITGIIGPNGSGKTTLMHLISGIIPWDSGSMIIGDTTSLERISPSMIRDFGITRTFQNVRIFEQMTVIDNILVVLTDRNVWGSFSQRHTAQHHDQAKDILELVGLWAKRDHLASSLSYGQRKLLEIARAIVIDAQIYLFDEPFAGLFPEMVQIVTGIMQTLREKSKTVILIEHNMFLIRKLSDQLYVFDSGQLLAMGQPDSVLARPDVRSAYLGE